MHSRFLRPASSTNRGEIVSDATSERARQLSVEKRWSQEAPVDGARSRRLSGTVYSLRILPLPAERHPRQQRDHLQRPAQIAEIMRFPPRPDLSGRAADPGVMHAVRMQSLELV